MVTDNKERLIPTPVFRPRLDFPSPDAFGPLTGPLTGPAGWVFPHRIAFGFDGFAHEFDLTPYLPYEGVGSVGNIFERMDPYRERVLIRSAIFFAYAILAVSKGYTYTNSLRDLYKCHASNHRLGTRRGTSTHTSDGI